MNNNTEHASQHLREESQALLQLVNDFGAKQGFRVCVVGGAVRDHLLGSLNQSPSQHTSSFLNDIDFVVEGDAIDFAEQIHSQCGGELKKFDKFFTAKILKPKNFPNIPEIDFASTRVETYSKPGALPTVVKGKLEDDLRRRDFSINAMALRVSDAGPLVQEGSQVDSSLVLDYFDSLNDLKAGHLKVLHPASFIDDPTRLFRAVRYADRFGFKLEKESAKLFEQAITIQDVLTTISAARIFNELRKMLKEANARDMVLKVIALGMLDKWTPIAGIHRDHVLETFLKESFPLDEERLLAILAGLKSANKPEDWGLSLNRQMIKKLRG